MPSFEEEAFERARKLSHSRPNGHPPRRGEPPKPVPTPGPIPEPEPEPFAEPPKPPGIRPPAAPNMLETLFKDKEKSLIMMLLLLLMDEKSDPSLIFSLMYLLM